MCLSALSACSHVAVLSNGTKLNEQLARLPAWRFELAFSVIENSSLIKNEDLLRLRRRLYFDDVEILVTDESFECPMSLGKCSGFVSFSRNKNLWQIWIKYASRLGDTAFIHELLHMALPNSLRHADRTVWELACPPTDDTCKSKTLEYKLEKELLRREREFEEKYKY